MVAKFDTSMIPGTKESGSNAIAWVIGLGLLVFAGYKYVYLPYEAKKKAEAKK